VANETGSGDWIDAYRSSVQFGDQEFLHEIGGYGTADPLLKAAIREYGADIASVVPQSELGSPATRGESRTRYPNLFGQPEIYSRVGKPRLDLPKISNPWWMQDRPGSPHLDPPNPTGIKTDREALNDLWRHEYRHQGLDLVRERQDRSPWRKGTDFFGQMYSAPIDYELQNIFNPGWGENPSKFFGLTNPRKDNDEEALLRVMDMMYGKSQRSRSIPFNYLNAMSSQGLIDDPYSWKDHFVRDDPNNVLNKFEAYLKGKP